MRVASQNQDWESTITWTKAKSLEAFQKRPEDAEASYYKLTGMVRGRPQLFYLGKTFDQYAHWRLEQPDHQERIAAIQRAYPGVEILVSVGNVKTGERDRYGRRLIDEIESLLIFAHQPEFNANKLSWIRMSEWHYVTNQGDFAPLERIVYFGPAAGEEDE
jgi:hypothetical protein